MAIQSCLKLSKNRTSYVCRRAGELRKGKSILEMSQKEAFTLAHKEYKKYK